jgi:hypothetical protein
VKTAAPNHIPRAAVRKHDGDKEQRRGSWTRPAPVRDVGGVSQRKTLNVSMTPAAKKFVEELSGELGLSETQIHSRTLEWLKGQSDTVIRGVLGLMPPTFHHEIVRMALKAMKPAGKKRKG